MTCVRPYGEAALLVETAAPLALRSALVRTGTTDAVIETVPGARTLLVRVDPARATAAALADLADVLTALAGRHRAADPAIGGPSVELAVRYDGVDLAAVAAESGLSLDDVIARHSSAEYTVAFCGFSPGFAYLTGLDPALHLPRLASPRASVPGGSVAIAAEYTGVYPRKSPGGWRLVGTTDRTLWDAARDDPALLTPGTRVRFRAT